MGLAGLRGVSEMVNSVLYWLRCGLFGLAAMAAMTVSTNPANARHHPGGYKHVLWLSGSCSPRPRRTLPSAPQDKAASSLRSTRSRRADAQSASLVRHNAMQRDVFCSPSFAPARRRLRTSSWNLTPRRLLLTAWAWHQW